MSGSQIYKKKDNIRKQDLDHIQPKSLLNASGIGWERINHMANFAKVSSEVNRGIKSNRPLNEWMNGLATPVEYRKTHLIPDQPELWKIDQFDKFLTARAKLIAEKIKAEVPQQSALQPVLPVPINPASNSNTDEEADGGWWQRNWNNRLQFAEQYGIKDLFEQFHAAAIEAGLWVTPRERALVYHHNAGGNPSFITVYIYSNGWTVKVFLHHFPPFYHNSVEELNELLWEGDKWIPTEMVPQFIEKLKRLKTK